MPGYQDINTANPLTAPYPTGSYLIWDAGDENFRSAASLTEQPYHASGSHQLDVNGFRNVILDEIPWEKLLVVDLRQESHGFIVQGIGHMGQAVSWYADNDWSNVDLDLRDLHITEGNQINMLYRRGQARVFTVTTDLGDDRGQGRVTPIGYTDHTVTDAYDEVLAMGKLANMLNRRIEYRRVPVTDHCAPSERALEYLVDLHRAFGRDWWVHFHCHGGDGRTTTFLALWDMLCWEGPLPPTRTFAERQCSLFAYCLYPDIIDYCGELEDPWKRPLALERWNVIDQFRHRLIMSA